MEESILERNSSIYAVSSASYMRQHHPTHQNTMVSPRDTTGHYRKEPLPFNMTQNSPEDSGYPPYTQLTLSETVYCTLDSASLHTKPYGERSPKSTGYEHMAVNAGHSSPKRSERKENINQYKEFS